MVTYGSLNLTISSPQLLPVELLTLDEAKELAKVQHNEEDGLIYSFIQAARIAAEKETGFELAVKQWDLTLDYFPTCDIELPRPLQSVDLVQFRTSDGNYTTCTEGVEYIVDTARGVIMPPWGRWFPRYTPWPSSSVLVRFRSGYPATHPFWSNEGAMIMNGMKFLITDWYYQRDIVGAKGTGELPYRVKYLFGLFAKMRIR